MFSPFLALFLYIAFVFIFPLGGGELFFRNSFLLFICLLALRVYFLVFGGYYSGSKYSLLGSYRAVVQIISYEIVLIFLFIVYFFLMGS
ncbi:NADH-quinone oxidoreductase subunit H [Escherichia coli]|nr:NADH-quinone oxidoreductase subunit H [Escherichia coli]